MKYVTHDQADAKRRKAAQFLRDVVGDEDRAEAFDDMSVEDYAERKGLALINPAPERRTEPMAYTKAQLMERVRDLEEENEDLYDRLDGVIAAAQPEPDEDEEDGDDQEADDQDAEDEDGDEEGEDDEDDDSGN